METLGAIGPSLVLKIFGNPPIDAVANGTVTRSNSPSKSPYNISTSNKPMQMSSGGSGRRNMRRCNRPSDRQSTTMTSKKRSKISSRYCPRLLWATKGRTSVQQQSWLMTASKRTERTNQQSNQGICEEFGRSDWSKSRVAESQVAEKEKYAWIRRRIHQL